MPSIIETPSTPSTIVTLVGQVVNVVTTEIPTPPTIIHAPAEQGPAGPPGTGGGSGPVDLNLLLENLPLSNDEIPSRLIVKQSGGWARSSFNQLVYWLIEASEVQVIAGNEVVLADIELVTTG